MCSFGLGIVWYTKRGIKGQYVRNILVHTGTLVWIFGFYGCLEFFPIWQFDGFFFFQAMVPPKLLQFFAQLVRYPGCFQRTKAGILRAVHLLQQRSQLSYSEKSTPSYLPCLFLTEKHMRENPLLMINCQFITTKVFQFLF